MLEFVAGFVIAVFLAALMSLLLLRHRGWILPRKRDPKRQITRLGTQIEELSRLAGGLAHEIKNPLSTIKVNLKLIGEEWDEANLMPSAGARLSERDEKLARSLRKIAVIQKELERLERTLEDFLRYVGRTELQVERADINELLGEMIDFYWPQARSHSITVRTGFCTQPLLCKLDPAMLKQAILNLFINARQAMNESGELMIRTSRRKNFAVIEVSDTGSGMSVDKLNRIFDAYYSSRSSGSGLGLPTTKKIIEAHRGSIEVASEIGKGTQFTIKLPLL